MVIKPEQRYVQQWEQRLGNDPGRNRRDLRSRNGDRVYLLYQMCTKKRMYNLHRREQRDLRNDQ